MYISKRSLVLISFVLVVFAAVSFGGYRLKALYDRVDASETITDKIIQAEMEYGFEQRISTALEKYRQGSACFAQENFECAIKHLEESVEIFPFSNTYLVLGNAYSEAMRDEEALEAYQIAIERSMQNGNGKITSAAWSERRMLKDFLKTTKKFKES
jgi:tetratricopeptide (TPR) repeat protein